MDMDGLVGNPTSVTIGSLDIRGFISPHRVANFLGIPYAEIPARFRQAKPLKPETLQGVHDGTKYGPRCPQPLDHPKVLRAHLYEGVIPSESIPCSEFRCLNLNVFAPPEAVGSQQRLPVYVWIHGGGWKTGDGGLEYDGNFLVEHAINAEKPMVYVGINYRLGYCGWLTSQELTDEALRAGEKPFRNMGLLDQRLALQWVQENIGYFGGDPDNVTIAGESAGGWSVLAHLRSNIPVCKRGIIMSCPSHRFPTTQDSQATFDRLVASTGVVGPDAPATEKLAALRDMAFEQLDELTGGKPVLPAWDPEWFGGDIDTDEPTECVGEFPRWVEAIVTGFTRDEFSVFGIVKNLHTWSKEKVKATISQVIPDPDFAQEICAAYGIDRGTDKDAIAGMFDFASDSVFNIAAIKLGQVRTIPASTYRFDQIDHGDCPYQGYAYHGQDNAWSPRLPAVAGPTALPEYKATADHQSQMILDLVHGQQPWETFATGRRIMRFDGEKSGLFEWSDGLARIDQMTATKEKEVMFQRGGWALMNLG
ncbi:hypothetical protein ASPZODRAFT_13100 [Penicilliopsis zonata CBS 506.65]|uniref:Carboxylic ester hydrolase n=1 Tax=Penicilliopsis zonata CBS 506.65 TaxID=1073090 RepID=A0A1L9SSC1_9EURO|nr:hypothetical protein ASPZODRAFT_13100 [Penicilliopsis zonata CBS 506.65]OJJ49997.1 hypothetical protein ASPZODRAFT_13100 [Penicilliopsis zonata CBS 506.65]